MKKILGVLVLVSLFFCSCSNAKTGGTPEKYFDDFFNNRIPAYRSNGTELWNKDLIYDDNDRNSYRIDEQVDVDNDGEKEQLINGLKGGFFLDFRDSKLYVFPEIAEPIGDMTYRQIDGKCWIIYKDALHSDREYYRMIRYSGSEVVDDIEIKQYEDGDTIVYYINSEVSTEDEYNAIKKKYID